MEQGEQRRSGRREASGGAGRGNIPAPKETVDRGEGVFPLFAVERALFFGDCQKKFWYWVQFLSPK